MTSRTLSGRRLLRSEVPGAIVHFWIVKVLCTTVGETAADLLDAKLGLGTVVTSALFLAVILGLVVYLTVTRKDVTEADGGADADAQGGAAGRAGSGGLTRRAG
ncbi:hypothetical protein ACWC24_34160 [Streptomyces sp. NPDC001443]